jgi:hypothetical protein
MQPPHQRRTALLLLPVILLVGALLLGCDGDEPVAQPTTTSATPGATMPTGTPRPPTVTVVPATEEPPSVPAFGLYPPGTRSGIDIVDAVLTAVENQDLDALEGLSTPQERPCNGYERGPGVVTCPESAPLGTPVAVFGSQICDTVLVSGEDLTEGWQDRWRQFFRAGFGGSGGPAAMRLYAVARVGVDAISLDARYQLVFASDDGWPHQIWLDDQGIVQIGLGCDEISVLDARIASDDVPLPPLE